VRCAVRQRLSSSQRSTSRLTLCVTRRGWRWLPLSHPPLPLPQALRGPTLATQRGAASTGALCSCSSSSCSSRSPCFSCRFGCPCGSCSSYMRDGSCWVSSWHMCGAPGPVPAPGTVSGSVLLTATAPASASRLECCARWVAAKFSPSAWACAGSFRVQGGWSCIFHAAKTAPRRCSRRACRTRRSTVAYLERAASRAAQTASHRPAQQRLSSMCRRWGASAVAKGGALGLVASSIVDIRTRLSQFAVWSCGHYPD
jgi:hypothetical protein